MLRDSELELKIKNKISEIFLTIPDAKMYDAVLNVVLKAMKSKYGTFGYNDIENERFICSSMTKGIWDKCQMSDKSFIFPRNTWAGIWGRALIEKKTFRATGPFNIPEGHITITRVLATPIIYQGQAIGLFLVGNKSADYDDNDQELLEKIADYIAPVLHARLQRNKQEEARNQAEKTLWQEKKFNESLLETAQAIVLVLDVDGRIKYFNPYMEEISGYKLNEVQGEDWFSTFLPTNDHERIREIFLQAVTDIKTRGNINPILTKKGSIRQIEWFDKTLKDIDGTVTGLVAVGQDITERMQAESELAKYQQQLETLVLERTADLARVNEELKQSISKRKQADEKIRESEECLRSIFNSSRDALLVFDLKGNIVDANPSACKMYGYSYDEITGLTGEVINSGCCPFVERIRQISKQQEMLPVESLSIRKDGTMFSVEVQGSFFEYRNKERLLAVIRDIGDRKQADEKLAQTMAELARSNAELERFAYVVSHDLQEPLRGIKSFTDLLARRYKGQFDSRADEFIEFILASTTRMNELINDLLTFSRIRKTETRAEPIDVNDAMRQVLVNLAPIIQETNAVVTYDTLPTIMVNNSQIIQLLQNLVGNSIKFRSEKPVRIHISSEQKGNEWLFSVCDNGIGFEQQYADGIFDIFRRLHTSEEYPGTGIGLAICKRIVEYYGGDIWAESEPKKGATFYFTLPI